MFTRVTYASRMQVATLYALSLALAIVSNVGVIEVAASTTSELEIASLQLLPVGLLPADPAADYVSRVTYTLPWQEGAWFIFWGGNTELQNYHVVASNQRHASDIIIWKDCASHSGDGSGNDQYHVWG